jgi:hypothetical protein
MKRKAQRAEKRAWQKKTKAAAKAVKEEQAVAAGENSD